MAKCLLSLGSNLGDRAAHLQASLRCLGSLPQTTLLAQSSFRDTNPAGGPAQDPFLNAAALIETSLDPLILLRRLQLIEAELGRVRTVHWGPRTVDIDLLLYDQTELNTPELTIPHPRMAFRRFVLEPAAEIAAEMIYPINGWTIGELLGHLKPWNRLIVLRSTDGSNHRLLKALSDCPNVRVHERKKLQPPTGMLDTVRYCRERLLKKIVEVDPDETTWKKWLIAKQPLEILIPGRNVTTAPALVVVWQEQFQKLESLDRSRHREVHGPHLWIPGVPLEQARNEVIAAMAAME